MSPGYRRAAGTVAAVMLLAASAGTTAAEARGTDCEARLTIELTPDVPDASNQGFLSSLLDNHPAYRLDLLREDGPSVIEVELAGPGPDYLCQGVIETMRKDARVQSLIVDFNDSEILSALIAPESAGESRDVHVSSAGLGSLYWAAHHPAQAWRVLLPIRPALQADAIRCGHGVASCRSVSSALP
jgi:hypothetical protein